MAMDMDVCYAHVHGHVSVHFRVPVHVPNLPWWLFFGQLSTVTLCIGNGSLQCLKLPFFRQRFKVQSFFLELLALLLLAFKHEHFCSGLRFLKVHSCSRWCQNQV
jgi:hypothetical protein